MDQIDKSMPGYLDFYRGSRKNGDDMSENVIIYHKDCFDGVTGAWIVNKYLRDKGERDIQLTPATYGDLPPNVKNKKVVIVDFSYPRTILDKMLADAESLIVLDHHKTAAEDLKYFPHAVFDMDRSGAGIAWDWFFLGKPRPWLVNCVEDRDLWKFSLPLTKAQMAYIASIPMNLEFWEELSQEGAEDVAVYGRSILKYIENYGHKSIEHASMHELGGYAFWIINVSYQNCSDHLDLMMKVKDWPLSAYFFLRGDGKWQFGMRSRGDFDVSEVAKKYGGGGHKNAAGFVVDELPWIKK